MKIKTLITILCILTATSLFGQKRDTIYIYDTIRVKVKRTPPPPSDHFFAEKAEKFEEKTENTATFSKDSIIVVEETKKTSTMNNFRKSANQLIRNLAMGTVAAVSSVTPLTAQDTAERTPYLDDNQVVAQADTVAGSSELGDRIHTIVKEVKIADKMLDSGETELKYAPVNIGFAYPISIYNMESPEYTYNFAWGFLTDVAGGIDGIQWSMLYNQVNGIVRGIQWAGLINLSGSLDGIQCAAVCNFTRDMRGIQWAGILNQSADMQGIQCAAVANIADHVEGIQWAGIFNAADSVKGMQWTAVVNEAQDVEGMQFAGIYNSADNVKGLQIGIINRTKTLNGLQIGFFNKVDSIEKGLSIGVFNFLKHDRFRELEVSVHGNKDYSANFLTYRLGGMKMHGIFALGTNWQQGNWQSRIGFGNVTRLKGSFYLQSSLYWNNSSYYRDGNLFDSGYYSDNWTTVSCGLVYYWGEKVGIKVVPSYNFWIDHVGSDYGRNWTASYDIGVDVGLSIRL